MKQFDKKVAFITPYYLVNATVERIASMHWGIDSPVVSKKTSAWILRTISERTTQEDPDS